MEMDDLRFTGQPKKDDPAELNIRTKLDSLKSCDWAKNYFGDVKNLQTVFLKKSMNDKTSPEQIRFNYEKLLNEIEKNGKTKIKSGLENLDQIKSGPVIVIVNHLGTAKITRINTTNLNLNKYPLEEIEPFPVRVAPINLIAKKTGMKIHECAIELPKPFLDIQTKSQIITIPVNGKERTKLLEDKVRSLILNEPKTIVVMYPEAGTTGKRNESGPYDLDNFHTGSFVIAKNLNLPILPVFQSFDPKNGYQLDILSPILPTHLQNTDLKKIAEITRSKMQKFAP